MNILLLEELIRKYLLTGKVDEKEMYIEDFQKLIIEYLLQNGRDKCISMGKKEFLKNLNLVRHGRIVWGADYDIEKLYYNLVDEFNKYFNINNFSERVERSLKNLFDKMDLLRQQLAITVDEIILQIERGDINE
jgi:hypothetical protein